MIRFADDPLPVLESYPRNVHVHWMSDGPSPNTTLHPMMLERYVGPVASIRANMTKLAEAYCGQSLWRGAIDIELRAPPRDETRSRRPPAIVPPALYRIMPLVFHFLEEHTDPYELVRRAVHAAHLHELDENLIVDGVRQWDPHT